MPRYEIVVRKAITDGYVAPGVSATTKRSIGSQTSTQEGENKKEEGEEEEEEEAQYVFRGKMLPHDCSPQEVTSSGQFFILRDCQVRRLVKGRTLLSYRVTIKQ